jgi:hypothetical protein
MPPAGLEPAPRGLKGRRASFLGFTLGEEGFELLGRPLQLTFEDMATPAWSSQVAAVWRESLKVIGSLPSCFHRFLIRRRRAFRSALPVTCRSAWRGKPGRIRVAPAAPTRYVAAFSAGPPSARSASPPRTSAPPSTSLFCRIGSGGRPEGADETPDRLRLVELSAAIQGYACATVLDEPLVRLLELDEVEEELVTRFQSAVDPVLQIGGSVEPQLARAHAWQVGLDVTLEVTEAHAQRLGRPSPVLSSWAPIASAPSMSSRRPSWCPSTSTDHLPLLCLPPLR